MPGATATQPVLRELRGISVMEAIADAIQLYGTDSVHDSDYYAGDVPAIYSISQLQFFTNDKTQMQVENNRHACNGVFSF
jgi:ubiquinone biosynthesis protein COQ9